MIGVQVASVQPNGQPHSSLQAGRSSAARTRTKEQSKRQPQVPLSRVLEGKQIEVPDSLWRDSGLTEGAKLLWCFLWAVRLVRQEFTYIEIRRKIGVCQNSLVKHFRELSDNGLLRWNKAGRRVTCGVLYPQSGNALLMPTDVLFDQNLLRPAKWVWGVIQRLDSAFDYKQLKEQTGYCRDSLITYLDQLRRNGWLAGSHERIAQRIQFKERVVNPREIQRQADLEELSQALELAKDRRGNSMGQSILARMLRVVLKEGTVIENAEVSGLENTRTRGQMHYDILLPEFKVAMEFHGWQHSGPTERFPDPEAFRDQHDRDVTKAGLTWIQGKALVVIWPNQLDFQHLREALAPLVPLKEDLEGQWHLYDRLNQIAKRYVRKVSRST